jgi:addiction module HigA family antidote
MADFFAEPKWLTDECGRADVIGAIERKRRPTPPGELLVELYLKPRGVSISRFAEAAGVTRKHMSAIVNGHASITADLATRIATVLGTTAQVWLNLQNAVDLYDAGQEIKKAKRRPRHLPFPKSEAAE